MSFTNLSLENFRRFQNAEFVFAETGISFITGRNGSGKSTILEAVHILCLGRSTRDVRFSSFLRQTESASPPAYFRIELESPQSFIRTASYVDGSILVYKENGKPCRRTDMIGRPPVVLFSPEELFLITGTPENRRRFMDRILSQESPEYLSRLRRYMKTLEERNALLKNVETTPPDIGSFLALDETLAQDGNEIMATRHAFVMDIQEKLPGYLEKLGALDMARQIRLKPLETASGNLLGALIDKRSQDLAFGHTSVGPHRDDIQFSHGKLPAASTLSHGEIRILTLSLKLLEAERLAQCTTFQPPVLLFDDLFSELDESRRLAVSEFLVSYPGQVLMTSCIPPPPAILSSLRHRISMD